VPKSHAKEQLPPFIRRALRPGDGVLGVASEKWRVPGGRATTAPSVRATMMSYGRGRRHNLCPHRSIIVLG